MALYVHALCKRFIPEIAVLHQMDVEVADGEIVVITGPSGSGKSTLLHCIAGLLTVDSGEVVIDDRRVNDVKPHQRGIGIVMQDQPLYEHLSVRVNIGFPLRARGEKRAEIAKKVSELLSLLELNEIEGRRASTLSGGERRRVALGRAMILRPRVLLLDEPLVSLEQELKDSLQQMIRRVHDEVSASTLLVTHDREEANSLGDRVVSMPVLNKQ